MNTEDHENKGNKPTAADAARTSEHIGANQTVSPNPFKGFPTDMKQKILSFLPKKDLLNVAQVDKSLNYQARRFLMTDTSQDSRRKLSQLYDAPVLSDSTKMILTSDKFLKKLPAELHLKHLSLRLEKEAKLQREQQTGKPLSEHETEFLNLTIRTIHFFPLKLKILYQDWVIREMTETQKMVVDEYFKCLEDNDKRESNVSVIQSLVALAPYLEADQINRMISYIVNALNEFDTIPFYFYRKRLMELVLNLTSEQVGPVSETLFKELESDDPNIQDVVIEALSWESHSFTPDQVNKMILLLMTPDRIQNVNKRIFYQSILKRLGLNLTSEQVGPVSDTLFIKLKEDNNTIHLALETLASASHKLRSDQIINMIDIIIDAEDIMHTSTEDYLKDILERVARNLTPDQVEPVLDTLLIKLQTNKVWVEDMALHMLDSAANKLTPEQANRFIEHFEKKIIVGSMSQRIMFTRVLGAFSTELEPDQIDRYCRSLIHLLFDMSENVRNSALKTLKQCLPIIRPDNMNVFYEIIKNRLVNENYDYCNATLDIILVIAPNLSVEKIEEIELFDLLKLLFENDAMFSECTKSIRILNYLLKSNKLTDEQAQTLFKSLLSSYKESSPESEFDEDTIESILPKRDALTEMIEILAPKLTPEQTSQVFEVAKQSISEPDLYHCDEQEYSVRTLKALAPMLTNEQVNEVIEPLVEVINEPYSSTQSNAAIHAILRIMPLLAYEDKNRISQQLEEGGKLIHFINVENENKQLLECSLEQLRYMSDVCSNAYKNNGLQGVSSDEPFKAAMAVLHAITLKLNSDEINQEVTQYLNALSEPDHTAHSIKPYESGLMYLATLLTKEQLSWLIDSLMIKLEDSSVLARKAAAKIITMLEPKFKTNESDISKLIKPLSQMLADEDNSLRLEAVQALRSLAPMIDRSLLELNHKIMIEPLKQIVKDRNLQSQLHLAALDTLSILWYTIPSSLNPKLSATTRQSGPSPSNNNKRSIEDSAPNLQASSSNPTAASAAQNEEIEYGNKRPRLG